MRGESNTRKELTWAQRRAISLTIIVCIGAGCDRTCRGPCEVTIKSDLNVRIGPGGHHIDESRNGP